MRTLRYIRGEMRLTWKYGIVMLYVILTLLYMLVLGVMPKSVKPTVAVILAFSDPAAMGLFFMGAVLLLEKSQRVHCALAVSPIHTYEYILAKVVPLLLVGLGAGALICVAGEMDSIGSCLLGIGAGSVLFSLASLFVATKTETVNSFVIAVIPAEIFITLPAILSLFGVFQSDWWLFHPCVAAIRLIGGPSGAEGLCLLSLLFWCAIIYLICQKAIKRYFAAMGGGRV